MLCMDHQMLSHLSAAGSHIHLHNMNSVCLLLRKTSSMLSLCNRQHMEAQAYTVVQKLPDLLKPLPTWGLMLLMLKVSESAA